jgi:tRNA uridine 5-carboxymethylaminomethyl modification enzyme
MVDDLITRGTLEPYRMFTSRAEYRLLLREDNADLRLSETGRRLGLVDDVRWAAFCRKREAIEGEQQRLRDLWVRPADLGEGGSEPPPGLELNREVRALQLLARPEVAYRDLMRLKHLAPGVEDPQVIEQLEVQAKYAGYIERQRDEIERQRANEAVVLPLDFDYEKVRGLSSEVKEKFQRHRPQTLGQAGRIPGVTPAAISLLLIHLKKRSA